MTSDKGRFPRVLARWGNAAATAAAWGSAFLLIGVPGAIIAQGHDALSLTLGFAGGAFLWAALLEPTFGTRCRERGLPGMLADYYGSRAVGALAAVVLTCALVGVLSAEIATVAMTAAILTKGGLDYPTAIGAAVLGVLTLALLGLGASFRPGVRSATAVLAVVLVGLLAALIALSATDGAGVLVSAPTIADIATLEQTLMVKRLADPATFKPFSSPFLRTDVPDFLAIVATLGIGIAMIAAARDTATASANPSASPEPKRALVLVTAALLLVPALAAASRRQLLSLFANGVPVISLPAWMVGLRTAGAARLCGGAGGGGADDLASLAKACAKAAGPQGLLRWQDVVIPQDGLLLASLASVPGGAAALVVVAAACLVAAIWTARTTAIVIARTFLTPPTDASADDRAATIAAVVGTVVLAALLLATNPGPSALVFVWSASIAAAGLAPALVSAALGQSNRIGAWLAIPLGAATAATLMLTARYDPLDAFAMAQDLTPASPFIIRKLGGLMQTLSDAPIGPARDTVLAQINALASDNLSWFGLKPLAGGIIGVVVGLIVMLIAAALAALGRLLRRLLTRAPKPQM